MEKRPKFGYMVLSIRELNEVIKKARQISKAEYNGKIVRRSTICLKMKISNKDYDHESGEVQVNIIHE